MYKQSSQHLYTYRVVAEIIVQALIAACVAETLRLAVRPSLESLRVLRLLQIRAAVPAPVKMYTQFRPRIRGKLSRL